jgi:fermentation-respiration switch protein FrsA (DUF1100 family)
MDLLKSVVVAIAVGYLAIAALVWLVQERLIFLPVAVSAPPQAPPGWRLEKVSVSARDGTRLAGVLLLPPVSRPALVIYYGGNAEEVTVSAAQAQAAYGDRAVLLMNYRGYGESAGRPGEKALVLDALEIFDWTAARTDLDAARIALHGRSLGTAIAVPVAAARPVKCVVLTSPFASAVDVAAEIYPWLPVSWMLRHRFDSASLAPRIRAPALVLSGEADTIIPKRHSDRLAAAWGGPVQHASFAGFGHNDLDLNPRYGDAIRNFLDRCT